MFDRILLMAEGRTAFLGPVSDALSFFAAQGLPCPPNYNPADFYIHTLATVPGMEAESKKKSKEICDAYDSSEANQKIIEIVKTNRPPDLTKSQEIQFTGEVQVKRSPYKASWFAQFRAVLWRSVISVLREPAVLRVKAFQTLVGNQMLCNNIKRNADFSFFAQISSFLPLSPSFTKDRRSNMEMFATFREHFSFSSRI